LHAIGFPEINKKAFDISKGFFIVDLWILT
jgi:hypothetical protein